MDATFSPDGKTLIVANEGSATWSDIDLTRLQVIAIPLGDVKLFNVSRVAQTLRKGVVAITPAIFKPYLNKKKRF